MITAVTILVAVTRVFSIAYASTTTTTTSSLSTTSSTVTTADVIDEVGANGKAVLNKAAMSGVDVRICSCDEQRICSKEMKNQTSLCIEPCWYKFRQVTDRPEDLKACFMQKQQILGAFLTCFENNVDSCVKTANGSYIQKTNITELLQLSEKALTKKADSITNAITAPIRKIIDAASEFGICVKDCFLYKNRHGFCFDQFDCQPHIAETKVKRTLKRCSRSIHLKKEAAELCDCAVDAGLLELKDYCAVFEIMASRRRQKPRRGRR